MSGEPFHRCTHTALSPKGDIYVSDGYGNARVHKYSPDGKLLFSWGEPGTDPGQFNIVHNICTDADGWVYVADRENHRVQVFDGNGKYEAQWNNLHRPVRPLHAARPSSGLLYRRIGAGAWRSTATAPISGRASASSTTRASCCRAFGDPHAGTAPTSFIGPHGLAVDLRGDLYVGEVCWTLWPRPVPGTAAPGQSARVAEIRAGTLRRRRNRRQPGGARR